MQPTGIFRAGWVMLVFCFLQIAASALVFQSERLHPDDLAFTGSFQGLPSGQTRYLSRSALAGVPGVTKLHEKLIPSLPAVDLTVLPLSALLAVLPLGEGADAVQLTCEDRWQSVLPAGFIKSHDPYLLLYYEGRTPAEGWPKFSNVEAFAPYYVNVSVTAHPEFNGVIDEGMISGTQVIELRGINVEQHYAAFYAGALARLSPKASEGRKIFIRECNNCHQGPGGVGGNTSQRPLLLLQTHASLNEDFFRKMVRRPTDFYPNTVMPHHEHFGEETFGPLIAFLRESRDAGTAADASIVPHYDKINTTRTLLSPEEVSAALARLPGWKSDGSRLTKTFVRKNFVEAIAFLDALVPECERLDHHPEIFTVYNKVSLTLTTFDAGQRISSFDVLLAGRIEAVAGQLPGAK